MEHEEVFYARFMDDWVIIAPTRWKLRKAVKIVNEVLNKLKVEKHPDKTFIGKVEKGFDFLGYNLTPGRIVPSRSSVRKFKERIVQLYEQGVDSISIEQYILRWYKWLVSGLDFFYSSHVIHSPVSGSSWSHQS